MLKPPIHIAKCLTQLSPQMSKMNFKFHMPINKHLFTFIILDLLSFSHINKSQYHSSTHLGQKPKDISFSHALHLIHVQSYHLFTHYTSEVNHYVILQHCHPNTIFISYRNNYYFSGITISIFNLQVSNWHWKQLQLTPEQQDFFFNKYSRPFFTCSFPNNRLNNIFAFPASDSQLQMENTISNMWLVESADAKGRL